MLPQTDTHLKITKKILVYISFVEVSYESILFGTVEIRVKNFGLLRESLQFRDELFPVHNSHVKSPDLTVSKVEEAHD